MVSVTQSSGMCMDVLRFCSQVQQGFQAFMDGESYVQQRQQALEGRSPAAAPPPSLVDKARVHHLFCGRRTRGYKHHCGTSEIR